MTSDWEQKLDKLMVEMAPLVKPGAIVGAFLGDEVCCHTPSCLNTTLGPVARKLRKKWSAAELFIWGNECTTSIVGGRGVPALPNKTGSIPPEIDILSIDYYAGIGNQSLDSGATEVGNVSAFLSEQIFPRMAEHQRAMVVPGFFGCSNFSTCGTPAQQDARMRAKLQAYTEYLASEPRIIGLAPWHLNNRTNGAPCDVQHKSTCHGCDMRIGAEAFKGLMTDWHAFGKAIVVSHRVESQRP